MDGNKLTNDYERKYDPILSKKSDFFRQTGKNMEKTHLTDV